MVQNVFRPQKRARLALLLALLVGGISLLAAAPLTYYKLSSTGPLPIGGDVIFQIDNTPVSTVRDIGDYISDKKIGDKVVVHYVRGKAKKTVTITLSYPSNGAVQSI